jgi:hypothetical protein
MPVAGGSRPATLAASLAAWLSAVCGAAAAGAKAADGTSGGGKEAEGGGGGAGAGAGEVEYDERGGVGWERRGALGEADYANDCLVSLRCQQAPLYESARYVTHSTA